MADPIDLLIVKDLEEALNEVESLGSVVLGRPETRNHELPCAGLVPINETTELEADSSHVNLLKVLIRVLVKENEEHALYVLMRVVADIARAVMVDPSRGGLAKNTRIGWQDQGDESKHYGFIDAVDPFGGCDLKIAILYQTEESEPAEQDFM